MPTKEKGATPFESAPTSETTTADCTAPKAALLLAWPATVAAFVLAGWLSEVAR